MKKLTYVLTGIISIFVFIFLFNDTSQIQYNKVTSFESSFQQEVNKDYYMVDYQLYDFEKNSTVHALLDFADKHHYDIITSVNSMRHNYFNDTTYYLHTDLNLNDLSFYKTINNSYVDFSSKVPLGYYTSSLLDNVATDTIDFIDSEYRKEYHSLIQYKSLNELINSDSSYQTVRIFIYGSSKEDIKMNVTNSEISQYVIDNGNVSFELAHYDKSDTSTIKNLLILSIASLVIISITDLIKKRREILVRKLFGDSNSNIYRDLIFKTNIINLFVYIFVQLILYAFMIRNTRSINLLLIIPLLQSFIFYLIIWFIANIISFIVLIKIRNSTEIKKSSETKFADQVVFVFKIILIILMIQPFYSLFTTSPDQIVKNYTYRNNKENMTSSLGISGIKEDNSSYGFNEIIDKLFLYFNTIDFMYSDFSSNYLPEELGVPEGYYEYPYIVANSGYLIDYIIKDENGFILDLKTLKHNTLLVPLSYKGIELNPIYCQGPCENIVYIQKGNTFHNNYPLVADNSLLLQEDPLILYKEYLDETMNWNQTTLLFKDNSETRNQIDTFLKDNKLTDIVFFESTNSIYDIAVTENNSQLLDIFMTVLAYLLIKTMFQYNRVFMFFSDNKSHLAVSYLFGDNYWSRYGPLLLTDVAVYIIPYIVGTYIGIDKKFMFVYIVAGIVIDLVISIQMIKLNQKREIVATLKGK